MDQNLKVKPQINVTNALIISCVVVYVLQWLVPNLEVLALFYPPYGLAQPWRFLTAAFLHASLIHLACNMAFLWVLGKTCERFFSQAQILIIYLLCAWGGSLGTLVWWRLTGNSVASVGASGAVLGLCAALFVFSRHLSTFSSALGGLLVINILLGFVLPGVAWHGHLGGIVIGCLVGLGMRLVSTGAGRAGRRHLGAEIPDVVDREKARRAASRVFTSGNIVVVVVTVVLLLAMTFACYAGTVN